MLAYTADIFNGYCYYYWKSYTKYTKQNTKTQEREHKKLKKTHREIFKIKSYNSSSDMVNVM